MPRRKVACSAASCEKPAGKEGLCHSHLQKKWTEQGPPPGAKTCGVDECMKPVTTRGWCYVHYYRWKRYGDPLTVKQIQGDTEKRLLSRIDQRGPDECWPWTGAKSQTGYGLAGAGGRRGGGAAAHRMVYETFVGPIPDGKDIDHLCHVAEKCKGGITCPHRACCNPKHLAPEESVANTMRGNSPAAINARKTHCNNGHEFNVINTHVSRAGKRACRPCRAAWKQRRRAAGLPA